MSDARRVHVLPDDLANQIAAGEVVERPASVVKELCENALDAGATRIRVEISQGGVERVRIVDDGSGMHRDDAKLAVLRHATSKLFSLDDLRCVRSFGFRGEALPSIASVSRFTLRTRRREDDEGTEIRIEGGAPAVIAPCGCSAGTTIEVDDLFFNVPARRKFLKATSTESHQVTDVVQSVALGRYDVTVQLARDGRQVKEWLRAPDREERVRAVHSGEQLAACRGERGPLVVEAFLSRPERARNGATGLSIFVNGRPVKDRALTRAVALAYGSVLEPGHYPVGVAFLDLPPDLVDVNVHPQKAEVRFADGRAVSDALFKLITADVSKAFGIPEAGGWADRRQPQLRDEPSAPSALPWRWTGMDSALAGSIGSLPIPTDPWKLGADPGGNTPIPAAPTSAPISSEPMTEPVPTAPSGVSPIPYMTALEREAAKERQVVFGALRYLAQSRSTFLICEGTDGLYVLDQHAAAERVTFHRLKLGFESKSVAMQKLLFPVTVEVAPTDVALVEEQEEAFARAGLEVRAAGPTQVAIHAVPKLLARGTPERLLRDLLGELGHTGERAYSGAVDLALATMACHGSLRAGDPVAPEEVKALLTALDEVDFAGHCPHGRPIVMRIGWPELETRVGRR